MILQTTELVCILTSLSRKSSRSLTRKTQHMRTPNDFPKKNRTTRPRPGAKGPHKDGFSTFWLMQQLSLAASPSPHH